MTQPYCRVPVKFTEPQMCYNCGNEFLPDELTTEHVPPKGLFPKPRPSNLITVPSCVDCNAGHSKDDELFRLATAAAINSSPAGKRVWEQRVVPRTFKRGTLKKDIMSMIEREQFGYVNLNGNVVPAVKTGVPAAPLQDLVERMVKGLLRHHYPEIPAPSLDYQSVIIPQENVFENAHKIFQNMRHNAIGDGVFRYYYNICHDAPNCGHWYLIFYEAAGFEIQHRDADHPFS